MKTINEYALPFIAEYAGHQVIFTPPGTFTPLSIKMKAGRPTLWAEVHLTDDSHEQFGVKRRIVALRTRYLVHPQLVYIDSIVFSLIGDQVLHYYIDTRLME